MNSMTGLSVWQMKIWQAMGYLVSHGTITYVGTSNFTPGQIKRGQKVAKKMGMMGLISEQHHFSKNRFWEGPENYEGVGYISYKSLERGSLAPEGAGWALDNEADVVLVGASSVEQLTEVVEATYGQ